MRGRLFVALSLALCTGCPAIAPSGPAGPRAPGKAAASKAPTRPSPGGSGRPVDVAGGLGAPADPVRVIADGALTIKTKLLGEVRLISDKGSGIVSNNSGTLVSNNGGALVSNNGSTLVSNNGGTVVANQGAALRAGNAPFRLSQAAAPLEARLADAIVEVLDAEGHLLAGADGEPITGATDAEGRYHLEAALPAENLVLRVRLSPAVTGTAAGGTLRALLAKGGGEAERRLDLDTAASVGASFVLDRLVQGRRAIYQKLGTADVDTLHRDLRSALQHLPQAARSYAPAALAAAADAIRRADPTVDGTLRRIEAILVAGQKDLGNGRPATEVALGSPTTALLNAAGELVIAESYGRRIRVVGADGRIRTLVGARVKGADAIKLELGVVADMALAPDGAIYVAEPLNARVRRIAPDGAVAVVAGADAPGGSALVRPTAIALAPDGSFYVGESPGYPSSTGEAGRIYHVRPGAAPELVPMPEAQWAGAQLSGLAVGPDGTLFACATNTTFVARKKPGAAWELQGVPIHEKAKRIALDAQGRLIIAEVFGRRVHRYDFASPPVLLAGTGEKGFEGDGGPGPASRWLSCASATVAPDGRVVVADAHAGVVRAIAPDGIVRTIAGAAAARVEGDAFEVAVNQPMALAQDPQGRLLITELAAHTVKRVEDGKLSVLVGGGSEDGGAAAQARDVYLDHPTGLAFDGDTMYLSDTISGLVRRVRADGLTEIVAGVEALHGKFNLITERSGPATGVALARPTSIAIGPDRRVYFSDSINNVVMRLEPDGTVAIVAGLPASGGLPTAGRAAEGAVASESPLKTPTGLAFDRAGNLYIAETGNYRIARLDPAGRITTFAGSTLEAALPRLGAGQPLVRSGDRATDAFLAGPAGLAFDQAGNLVVSVLGTTNLQLLGDFLPLATDVPVTVYPSVVRVAPDGVVTVLAGLGGQVLTDPEAEDALALPFGVMVDRQGRVVVADAGQNQVRAIPAEAR